MTTTRCSSLLLDWLAGGSDVYRAYSCDIGDATILHGKIGIVCLARLKDVESGSFSRLGTLRGQVHNGVNLGITRVANKVGQ